MRWLALLAFTPACSFVFVNGPPADHEKLQYFDCASAGGALAADITGATYFALSAAVVPQQGEEGDEKPPAGVPIALGAVAATYLASAIYGGYQGKQCDRAKEQLEVRVWAERKQLQEQVQEQQRLLEQQPKGCVRDTDCKDERICEASRCVEPSLQPPPSAGLGDVTTTPPVAPEPGTPTDATQGATPAAPTAFPPAPTQP